MRLFKGLTDFRTLSYEWRQQGARGALKTAREALRLRLQIAADRRFDLEHGVDTCGLTMLSDLSITSGDIADCVYYDPTPIRLIEKIFRRLPKDLTDFSFVDFGSGKGRVLLTASRLPFRRIIGVEFAKELHEIATRNIATYRDPERRCLDVTSLCIDARDFEIPGEKCVMFFYRPFAGPVFQRVLERIVASYEEHPRKMYLIYCSPTAHDPFKTLSFVENVPLPTPLFERVLPGGVTAVLYESQRDRPSRQPVTH